MGKVAYAAFSNKVVLVGTKMNKINIITSCLLGFSIVISQGEDFATDFTEEDLKKGS